MDQSWSWMRDDERYDRGETGHTNGNGGSRNGHCEESRAENAANLNTYHAYYCAFCGEENEVFVDSGGGPHQEFTEDCAVCCRPNLISITIDYNGFVSIDATQEYEA